MNQEQIKLYVDFMQDMQDITTLIEKAIALESKADKKFNQLMNIQMTEAEKEVLDMCSNQMYDAFRKLEDAIHE